MRRAAKVNEGLLFCMQDLACVLRTVVVLLHRPLMLLPQNNYLTMKATTNKSSHQLGRESLNKPLLDRDGSDFEKDDGISECGTVDNKIGILIDTNLNDSNSSFSLTGANVMAPCVFAAAGCEYSSLFYVAYCRLCNQFLTANPSCNQMNI